MPTSDLATAQPKVIAECGKPPIFASRMSHSPYRELKSDKDTGCRMVVIPLSSRAPFEILADCRGALCSIKRAVPFSADLNHSYMRIRACLDDLRRVLLTIHTFRFCPRLPLTTNGTPKGRIKASFCQERWLLLPSVSLAENERLHEHVLDHVTFPC